MKVLARASGRRADVDREEQPAGINAQPAIENGLGLIEQDRLHGVGSTADGCMRSKFPLPSSQSTQDATLAARSTSGEVDIYIIGCHYLISQALPSAVCRACVARPLRPYEHIEGPHRPENLQKV